MPISELQNLSGALAWAAFQAVMRLVGVPKPAVQGCLQLQVPAASCSSCASLSSTQTPAPASSAAAGDSETLKISITHVHRYDLWLMGVWPVAKRKVRGCSAVQMVRGRPTFEAEVAAARQRWCWGGAQCTPAVTSLVRFAAAKPLAHFNPAETLHCFAPPTHPPAQGMRCGSRPIYERMVVKLSRLLQKGRGEGGDEEPAQDPGLRRFAGADLTSLTILSQPYAPPPALPQGRQPLALPAPSQPPTPHDAAH